MSRIPLAAFTFGTLGVLGLGGCSRPDMRANPSRATALPTGQYLTPTLPPGATYTPLKAGTTGLADLAASGAVSSALSPDGRTLAVLTTGYNRWTDPATGKTRLRTEWVFLYDLSSGQPVRTQLLQVPNTWAGITFSPDGRTLYVSGGEDDTIHTFQASGGAWKEAGEPIRLGHAHAATFPLEKPDVGPIAAGIATTADGATLVVANLFNDSATLVDARTRAVLAEIDLRPGRSGGAPGTPGGTYPLWVAVKGNDTAYISSVRNREVVALDLHLKRVQARISLAGNPNKMILDRAQRRLLVAMDNADAVAVVDTATNAVMSTVRTSAPEGLAFPTKWYVGSAPNSLAFNADESRLYVTNNGTNSLAVIQWDLGSPKLIGLIPTGWSPQAVAFDAKADRLYVVNSKDLTGPNPGQRRLDPERGRHNQYILQLVSSGLQTLPEPKDPATLARLTEQVAANNSFGFRPTEADQRTVAFLRERIKHVIYIVRENRTYDQILGDLGKGKGDPALAEFPANITANQHALANRFVILDNFYTPGEVSGNGWPWSTGARETDFGVKMVPPAYAGRGGTYDWEGTNRNVPVGLSDQERQAYYEAMVHARQEDPDLLAGSDDVAAPDGPQGERQRGYLWSSALRAGLSVRNYGFFATGPDAWRDRDPYANRRPQAMALAPELKDRTDIYFRGFDPAMPELYRFREWKREFDQYVKDGNLPALSLVRFGQDHTGDFKNALDGVDTPETQVAANDYAIGLLVEAVAASPYAGQTLIIALEDDSQDGPDHVDARRSPCFIIGPYVKQGGVVVSTKYTTVNVLRTIEDVLGMDYLSLNDATQEPLTEVFDITGDGRWTYQAMVPSILHSTSLPLPPATVAEGAPTQPRRPASYWVEATRGMDFSKEDDIDADAYNRILWAGLMGDRPYPKIMRSGGAATKVDDDD